jgi:hypothetical protein
MFGFTQHGQIAHVTRETKPNANIFKIYGDDLQEFKMAFLSTGNGVGFEIFEFIRPVTEARPAGDGFQFQRPGIFHICVTNPDPDALAERVAKEGGKRIGQAIDPLGKGSRAVYCADPWGNVIEVLDVSFEVIATHKALGLA